MTEKSKKWEDDSFGNWGPKEFEKMKKKRKELSKPKEHGWWYDEKMKYLTFQIDKERSYDIKIDRLKNPRELINFIFHLLHKLFINEEDMYEFLEAVDMLLNPEHNPLYNTPDNIL
jgi:hypothetical protein